MEHVLVSGNMSDTLLDKLAMSVTKFLSLSSLLFSSSACLLTIVPITALILASTTLSIVALNTDLIWSILYSQVFLQGH